MKVALRNLAGESVGEVELNAKVFEAPVSQPLMHQAYLRQRANAHLGTHKAKTRAEVDRTTKKLFKQKGTGNARQGSRKAPHHRGGGVAFGPVVRSYAVDMPRKMRQAAIRSALSQKASDQQIIVIDKFEMAEPKARALVSALDKLGASKALLVLGGRNANVEKSASNLANVRALQAGYLNIRDIFTCDQLVIDQDALGKIDAWLGGE
ncbi:MAG: 50S ribosomal protein L4 [Thermoflexales bacterium]|nr:50S ribosomal protein L4 [Thermoflexales bacterium]